tara:strand:+ start:447 stop:647 length:201 start_codon:yes stop_codon:yes gene_type:complete
MVNRDRYFKLIKALRDNKELARNVKRVQELEIEGGVVDSVNSLNLEFGTHLFIMGNYSDLMNIKIE